MFKLILKILINSLQIPAILSVWEPHSPESSIDLSLFTYGSKLSGHVEGWQTYWTYASLANVVAMCKD